MEEKNFMLKDKKGQLSIVNIVFFLILVAIGSIVSIIIDDFLTTQITENNITGLSATIMNFIVPLFWIGIIITFFLYVTPVRPQQY